MAEVKKTGDTGKAVNALTFDEKVIRKIVGFSTNEIPGVFAMGGNLISGITSGITDALKQTGSAERGVSVDVGKTQVAVDMQVVCEYGQSIPNIFKEIEKAVSAAVMQMTGLTVVEVNANVIDVLLKDDFDRRKKHAAQAEVEMEAARVE